MPDDQVFRTIWRSPVLEGDDFFVCTANAHITHPQFDLVGRVDSWLRMIDDPDLFFGGEHRNSLHSKLMVAFAL